MSRRLPLILLAALLAAPATAAADSVATTNITVAVRSVTLSKTTLTCTPALIIPSGQCTTDAVRVTNGQTPSHIYAKTGQAVGSNGLGPNWVPCYIAGAEEPVPSGSTSCSGTSAGTAIPGTDQFRSMLRDADGRSTLLLESFDRDVSFGGTAASAAAGAFADETDVITAPTGSSNASPSFTTAITWMAAP